MNDVKSGPSCCVCGGYEYRSPIEGRSVMECLGDSQSRQFDILECVGCGLQKLEKFVMGQAEYASDEYRQNTTAQQMT